MRALLAIGLVASAIGGCSGDDLLGSDSSEIDGTGTWKLSPDAMAAGKVVRVPYDAAPVWRGTAACNGGLRVGARVLGEFLSDKYTAIDTVGGYACRRNTADTTRTSVHGTGRALDLMISMKSGAADSARGDVIANWLVMNAQRIGVQLIIWNHTVWRANGTNTAAYGGPNPHTDHIHVEIDNLAAEKGTPWFATMDDGDDDASTTAKSDASTDASRAMDGMADDDDASTTTPKPDASALPKDAGTSTVDASKPPTTTTDAGAPDTDDQQEGTLPPAEADPGGQAPGYGYEVPEGNESAPDDALKSKSKRSTPSVSDDEEGPQSKGCSAAPSGTTTRDASFAMFGLFGIALAITRRSKRS